MSAVLPILCALAAYLLGSLSFAVLLSRGFGLADPRSYGSGNPGATNVLRSGSKVAAVLTLAGDAFKGAVAIWLVRAFGPPFGLGESTAALAGLAAFVGHLYPVFFRFEGGKGVATFLGTLIALSWPVGLAACGTWAVTALLTRTSSVAALTAASTSAIWLFWFGVHGSSNLPVSPLRYWRQEGWRSFDSPPVSCACCSGRCWYSGSQGF
jgi:glycerol-3-phosphate acyltransferase PlsY